MTKVIISLSASSTSSGRGQAWFNSLTKKQQKEYLALHPKSKFGKPAAKSVKTSKLSKVSPKHKSHEFDSDAQEDAFFSKFDKLRGPGLPKEEGSRVAKEGKKLHDIKTSGGSYVVVQHKDKLYGILESPEGTTYEKIKAKNTDALNKVVDSANRAADKVQDSGEFDEHYDDF
jgi:hypothetical protein